MMLDWMVLFAGILIAYVLRVVSGGSAVARICRRDGLVSCWCFFPPYSAGFTCGSLAQQHYARPHGDFAQVVSLLHPSERLSAVAGDHARLRTGSCCGSDFAAAEELLNRFKEVNSLIGLTAVINLFRVTNQWEDLLEWYHRHERLALLCGIQMLFPWCCVPKVRLRMNATRAGRVPEGARARDGKLMPAASRDVCAGLCSSRFVASGKRPRAF